MKKEDYVNLTIEAALKIGMIALILLISFLIFKPFIVLIAWGAILGIAFYPLQQKLSKLFKGKNTLAATVLTVVLLLMLTVPTIIFVNKVVTNATDLAIGMKVGTISIPPRTRKLKSGLLSGNRFTKPGRCHRITSQKHSHILMRR